MATAGPSRAGVLGAPVLVVALLLVGCGPADTAAPGTPLTSSTPSAPSAAATTAEPPASTPSSSAQGGSWNASGPSFGVDRADWPGTGQGAERVLASLPKTLSGERLEVHALVEGRSGGVAEYGKLASVFVWTEEDQEGPHRLKPYQLLIPGLGAVCAEETYTGTAGVPVLREGEQEPALSPAAPGVEDGSQPAWFSCQPKMERDEWGHAVGWTSGSTAWILYARDEKAARTLITALHAAAR